MRACLGKAHCECMLPHCDEQYLGPVGASGKQHLSALPSLFCHHGLLERTSDNFNAVDNTNAVSNAVTTACAARDFEMELALGFKAQCQT